MRKVRWCNLIDEYSERKTLKLNLKDFKGEDSYFEENKIPEAAEVSRIIQKANSSSRKISKTKQSNLFIFYCK